MSVRYSFLKVVIWALAGVRKSILLIPFKKYSIQDLVKANLFNNLSVFDKRKHVRIAVIDDEEFTPLEGLLADGYQIAFLGKCNEMRPLRNYHIVVCDIGEVGKLKNSEEHGAAIIAEIKRVFPEKPVIVYTGLVGNIKKLRLAKERADEYISKGAELDIWNQVLDDLIDRCLDPKAIWQASRKRLEDGNVPLKEIAYFEDKYVRAVMHGDSTKLNALKKKKVNEFAQDVISGLVSSALWTVIAVA